MAIIAWPPPTPPNTRQNVTPELDNHPSDHNRIADALDTIIGTPWAALPLAAGWTPNAGYIGCQYRMIGDRVEVRGVTNHAAVAAPVAITTALPAAFRPTAIYPFVAMSSGILCELEATPAGIINLAATASNIQITFIMFATGWSVT